MADEMLREIRDAVREANLWLKVLALPKVHERLSGVLTRSEERRVYQASDGGSVRQVAEAAGVSPQTVSNYWAAWKPFNILSETDTKGRYKKVYDLAEINLENERDRNPTNGA